MIMAVLWISIMKRPKLKFAVHVLSIISDQVTGYILWSFLNYSCKHHLMQPTLQTSSERPVTLLHCLERKLRNYAQ